MNLRSDFRYVDNDEFSSKYKDSMNPTSGSLGKYLIDLDTVTIQDNSLFSHAGVLPQFSSFGIHKINEDLRRNILNQRTPECKISPHGQKCVSGTNGPIWTRYFARNDNEDLCETLEETLKNLNVKRMIIGHNPVSKIQFKCDMRLVLIDVESNSKIVQVLKIENDLMSVITKDEHGKVYEDKLVNHDEL